MRALPSEQQKNLDLKLRQEVLLNKSESHGNEFSDISMSWTCQKTTNNLPGKKNEELKLTITREEKVR